MAKSKVKKEDYTQMAMDLGLGLAGGIAANQLSNIIEKQDFMLGKEQFVPAIPAALGGIAYFLLPKEFRPIAFGMFVASGTEGAETLIAKATGAMAGITPSEVTKQLGFTPQFVPKDQREGMIKTQQGVVVR